MPMPFPTEGAPRDRETVVSPPPPPEQQQQQQEQTQEEFGQQLLQMLQQQWTQQWQQPIQKKDEPDLLGWGWPSFSLSGSANAVARERGPSLFQEGLPKSEGLGVFTGTSKTFGAGPGLGPGGESLFAIPGLNLAPARGFEKKGEEGDMQNSVKDQLGEIDRCSRLLAQLQSTDNKVRNHAIAAVRTSILQLAMSPHGGAVVQKALSVARVGGEQDLLVKLLRGHVRELATCLSGTEVLQACLEFMPPTSVRFIVHELTGVSAAVAKLREGHGVLCTALEHLPQSEVAPIMEELLNEIGDLCNHVYGNQVVQRILQYGHPIYQQRVIEALTSDIKSLVKDHGVSATLQKSSDTDSRGQWDNASTASCADSRGQWDNGSTFGTPSSAEGLVEDSLGEDYLATPPGLGSPSRDESVPVTTLMIRGIPCGFTQQKMLDFLDQVGFSKKYDFLYLPRAGRSQSNKGYLFVNFIDPIYATNCAAAVHGVALDPGRSAKVCTVSPADIQGLDRLKSHFRRACVCRSARGPVFFKANTLDKAGPDSSTMGLTTA